MIVKNGKRRFSLIILALFLSLIPLYLYSCGGGGYGDPQVQATSTSVLISPQALNEWLTKGYGVDAYGYNKIVVVDATSAAGTAGYTTSGHVPGSFLVDPGTDLTTPRSDGVSSVITEVATKAQIEDVIHRTGIDERTVVVITGDSLLNVGTTYFTFRYWGFPK